MLGVQFVAFRVPGLYMQPGWGLRYPIHKFSWKLELFSGRR